jgi:hypothetical protein
MSHSNPKCYAAELGGCSQELSREHFFSKAILKLLNDGPEFKISGLPWQELPGAGIPSPGSLSAKVLCRHHDSVLEVLDRKALQLFTAFEAVNQHLSGSECEDELVVEICGDKIERWIFKALTGVVASGNAGKGSFRVPKSKPPLELLQFLFGQEELPDEWGLYLIDPINNRPMAERAISFAPIIQDDRFIRGAVLHVHGFQFLLVMSNPGPDRNYSLLDGAIYRPTYLRFEHSTSNCSAVINFTWTVMHKVGGLTMKFHPIQNSKV